MRRQTTPYNTMCSVGSIVWVSSKAKHYKILGFVGDDTTCMVPVVKNAFQQWYRPEGAKPFYHNWLFNRLDDYVLTPYGDRRS